jgi:hypothetical protein
MSFLMERDLKNRQSVSLGKGQRWHRPVGQPEGTGFSNTGPKPNTRPFVDDFDLEHSFSGVSVTLKAISASSEAVATAAPRKPRTYDMNSPNCVYIG